MLHHAVRRKVVWRILPLMFVLYIIAYLDRANVGFAKLRMQKELELSDGVFGIGVGIFYVGYLLLEIPGAVLVERWSARKWFTRILVSWGVCSMAMALVRTPTQFYVVRFLLGFAEAGFFPGVIVYLTHWFVRTDRARAFAGLILAVPLSLALGARVSGWLLEQHVPHLSGWQLVFLAEGAPAVGIGMALPFIMTDRPRDARWLTTEERTWLENALEQERLEREALGTLSWGQVLRRPAVWLLALSIFATNTGGIALSIWLPSTIKDLIQQFDPHATDPTVLNWTGLVFLFAVAGVWVSGRTSDRLQERKWHAVAGKALSGLFLAASLAPGLPWPVRLVLLCAMGFFVLFWAPPFWALPSLTLPPTALAVAIGFINIWANIAGGVGSPIVGAMKDAGLSDTHCMLFLACCYLAGAAIIAFVRVPQPKPNSPLAVGGPHSDLARNLKTP